MPESPEVQPPPIAGVLESVLYYTDEQASHDFYTKIMGFRSIGHQPGRSLFFRAGESVFLLFDAEATAKGGQLLPHGAQGPGHVCFRVSEADYFVWKNHLMEREVEILQEVTWPLGSNGNDVRGSSFYFHDPSGNVLEIANSDFWPR